MRPGHGHSGCGCCGPVAPCIPKSFPSRPWRPPLAPALGVAAFAMSGCLAGEQREQRAVNLWWTVGGTRTDYQSIANCLLLIASQGPNHLPQTISDYHILSLQISTVWCKACASLWSSAGTWPCSEGDVQGRVGGSDWTGQRDWP